jgi:hypothetical protein
MTKWNSAGFLPVLRCGIPTPAPTPRCVTAVCIVTRIEPASIEDAVVIGCCTLLAGKSRFALFRRPFARDRPRF